VDLGIFQKHVLLPVGHAVVDSDDDKVWVQGLSSDRFEDIPKYEHDGDEVSAEFEQRVMRSYDEVYSGPNRYNRPEHGGAWPDDRPADATRLGAADVSLSRLSDLDDYEVADHESDPRGWELVGANGDKIGEVDDLIVDPQALKARYLEVEVDDDRLLDPDRDDTHMLIPVGYARLDDENRRVRVDSLSAADVRTIPLFEDEWDPSYEDRINRHFSDRFQGETRYSHPRFDADRFYSTRSVERGIDDPSRAGRACDVRLRR
jgi:photosynthetic reaction center H subunit